MEAMVAGYGPSVFGAQDMAFVRSISWHVSCKAGFRLDLWKPQNHETIVSELEDGIFTELFTEKYKREGLIKHAYYFGALALRLGVKIGDEDLKTFKAILKRRFPGVEEVKMQIKKAFEAYKNDGTPWVFDDAGQLEAAKQQAASKDDGNVDAIGKTDGHDERAVSSKSKGKTTAKKRKATADPVEESSGNSAPGNTANTDAFYSDKLMKDPPGPRKRLKVDDMAAAEVYELLHLLYGRLAEIEKAEKDMGDTEVVEA
ncbi:uncharacterized protein KY384_004627 [Bacidia gigantensis]|uniref:uncharacterized protein n=1 Tax=Bacidia gigantensis TaxID=2732470 RepID=UPI001D045B79|nr:uncharacterized protein KY384_004627 [Bacidia gigantensis]KAG8531269.1 hypothetical protein KY384_004627 [Bacidia gigantensis]